MNAASNLSAISEFILENHVISICAATASDIWCANCFYVYDAEQVCFYFMTDPDSRHSQLAIQQTMVAGTINGQPSNILSIKGLQYRGTMTPVHDAEHSHAYALYTNSFPIAKIKSLPLWKIEIQEMKFTNNSLGFGRKKLWQRSA